MLNQFLMPESSPIAINQGAQDPYSFDFNNERGVISTTKIGSAAIQTAQIQDAAITSAKVGTLTFNQISGGTATLGGTANGNGLMSVKNSSGSEVVKLDSSGITVTNGSLNIYNSSGSVAFDSAGVVSTSNFTTSVSYYNSVGQLISGTSDTVITNGTIVIGTASRSRNVMLLYNYGVYMAGGGPAVFKVKLNGSEIDRFFVGSYATQLTTTGGHYVTNLNSSAHTVTFTAYTDAGTVTIYSERFSYVILGN